MHFLSLKHGNASQSLHLFLSLHFSATKQTQMKRTHQTKTQKPQQIKIPSQPRYVPNDNDRFLQLLRLGHDPVELGLAGNRHERHRDRRIIELLQRPFLAQSIYGPNWTPNFIKFTGKDQRI